MLQLVGSIFSRILAIGQTDAEDAALLWADANGIVTFRSPSTSFSRRRRAASRQIRALLFANVLQSEGSLLLSVNFDLGPEQKQAIEFLGTNRKPFLHLWPSVPQAGLLARRFLETHEVTTLNVVGSARDDGGPIQTFARSVFGSLLTTTHA
jgi:hypothetical protein